MSCTSPFIYQNSSGTILTENNIGFNGTTSTTAFTYPTIQTCWNDDCYQTCETSSTYVGISPYTLEGSANINLQTTSTSPITLSVSTPSVPYQVSTLIVNSGSVTVTLNINGNNYSSLINIVPNIINIPETNNNFETIVPLEPSSGSFFGDGYSYSSTGNLLFCYSTNEVWMSISIALTVYFEYYDDGYTYSYNITNNLILPITSVTQN